MTEVNTMNI